MMDEETEQNIPRKTHGIPSGVNGAVRRNGTELAKDA